MIDRGFVGKKFPPFELDFSPDHVRELDRLLGVESDPDAASSRIAWNWPAFLTLRGTACLLGVWEELGVDPLTARLTHEEFLHHRVPEPHGKLVGRVAVDDVTECVDDETGTIEDQIELSVRFDRPDGQVVAEYCCSFRIPLLVGSSVAGTGPDA